MKRNDVQMKRWVWASIAAFFFVAYALHSRASPAPGESCGLGLPPGAPGFAEAKAREEAEVRKYGFLRVCDVNLERYELSFSSLATSTMGLAFEPVDLTQTAFSQFRSLGGRAEAVNDTKSRLYRGFRMPDGHTVTLFEHDMSADGSRNSRNPKDELERINGLPARLVVLQASSGRAVSNLSWTEGRRNYELWVDANVARQPLRVTLFALAVSLPASIPACPNEPQPEAVVLGPDGIPVVESPPAVLTDVQMKALFDKSKRPCK
jgi:hypothetical protein